MAILEIRTVPDPILRQKAKRVRTIDNSIKKLIRNMRETLHAAPGRVGLAAPQIGTPLRVIVIGIPEAEDIILVNPEIMRRRGERLIEEGCLSIPGYFAQVKRAEFVTARGRNTEGKDVKIKADGLLAQALEHEVDHLNGVLYIDYLESPDKLIKVGAEEATPEI